MNIYKHGRKFFVLGWLSMSLISGCATTKDSVFLGMGVGAVGGAGSGMLMNRDIHIENSSHYYKGNTAQGALIGSLVGAAVGGLSAYLIHGSLESRDNRVRQETLINLKKHNVSGIQNEPSPFSDKNFWPGNGN